MVEDQTSYKENEPRDSWENYFIYEKKQQYLEIPSEQFYTSWQHKAWLTNLVYIQRIEN